VDGTTFKARATSVINTLTNEGFFADCVVVVEGLSDAAILWEVQEQMHLDWQAKSIVIVPAMGKANLDRLVIVFRGYSIPTYFVWDADGKHAEKNQADGDTASKNRRYLKLAKVTPSEFPETRVDTEFAVFKDDIEGVIKAAAGDQMYLSVLRQVASEHGYSGERDVMKNPDCAASVVSSLYSHGVRVQTLEAVVNRISDLRG